MIIDTVPSKHYKKILKKSPKTTGLFSVLLFFFVFVAIFFINGLNCNDLNAAVFNEINDTKNFLSSSDNISQNHFNDLIAESNDYIDITADAAIIFETDSDRILWQKNSMKEMYPASTTKMLTAITAIERISDLGEVIKIPPSAAGSNNSFYPFKTGQEISLIDLLKAALLSSHNNATIALGEHISGSEAEFVKLMNAKAIEIGAYNTNFQNTNGLDSDWPEHKTTAYDLALIATYCMNNELFKEIVSTEKDTITLGGERMDIYNTNTLLFFDYIHGIKTGFTNNAGYCLAISSSRQDLNLITVVLNCEGGKREADILKLINWANDNYFSKKILDSTQKYKSILIQDIQESDSNILKTTCYADVFAAQDYEKLISVKDKVEIADNLKESIASSENINIYMTETPVSLPAERGFKVGKIDLYLNNKLEKSMDLLLGSNVDKTYISIELTEKYDKKAINTLIAIISFYFLIFIFIIIRNLILSRRDNLG